MTDIRWTRRVTPTEVAAVDAMLDRTSLADGVSSLSEHTYLHLLSGGGGNHALARVGDVIVGYGYVSDDAEPVAEFLVDPASRGRGVGGKLLEEVLDAAGPRVRIWAHGRLPAAAALAEGAGMVPVRRLCRYTRGLHDIPQGQIPEGIRVRPFAAGDESAWLDLNAAAFVDLPDQGRWTRADLDDRLAQPWFDPQGFLLAFDDHGLAGFHWTKVHGGSGHGHDRTGEVYVLAVAPRARGTGLGSALTCLGLAHLAGLGLSTVMLYVDVGNVGAVGMYEALGFRHVDCDEQFALPAGP